MREKRRRNFRKKGRAAPKAFLERKKTKKIYFIILGILSALFFLFLVIIKVCHVKTITVEGNLHYTNDEIVSMVMGKRWEQNSVYLSLKYRKKDIRGIPFIEKLSVNIIAPDEIKITVYEKAVAGYIEYLGKYMYFDKDGIIVETSESKTEGIPQITGLEFDYVILHEELPIENKEIFQAILDMTQLLEKYRIQTDKIYFDKDNQMILYFKDIKVRLGDITNIDEKIIYLKTVLPKIEGEKGILHMENFDKNSGNIIFNKES